MAQLDHISALARLGPEAMARLTQKSNRHGLARLVAHVMLIACLGLCIALRVPLWPLLLVPLGIALSFLFTLEHEATHQTPFASLPLNEGVGHLCGLVLMLPFTWFRYFHLAHHRHTNDPKRDPELLSGQKPATWPAYILHLSGVPYWVGMAQVLGRIAFGRIDTPFIPKRARRRIAIESRCLLAAYGLAGLTLMSSDALVWLWIVPLLLGQPFLRLFLLAEHSHCPAVANMFANTRTTLTNHFVRFLAWNMPYHAEHHAAPHVPFHNLPDLHDQVQHHLVQTAPGYRAFTRDYAGTLTECGRAR